MAAFLVAFFSSFFSYSAVDYSLIDGHSPASTNEDLWCQAWSGSSCTNGLSPNSNPSNAAMSYAEYAAPLYPTPTTDITNTLVTNNSATDITYKYELHAENIHGTDYVHTYLNVNVTSQSFLTASCPPNGFPNHVVAVSGQGGEIDKCYHPEDIQAQLDEENELDRNEDYCKGLILDSGNNTSADACYSAPNGSQCSVSKVTVSSGDTYYQGTNNEVLGCGSSDKPPFDQQGIGDDSDDCVYSDGVNYCKANKEKHCSDTNGITSCDSGCIESGDIALCDASKHPDVGEGDSDYFNSNGTCSAISASSSKGFCEEMGGTWDDNAADFQETSCPVGSGSCSTGSTICGACIDEGGVWTPDANAQTDINAINDVSQRIKDSNIKLSAIENTTRKSGEAITSTIKSGNGKIVAAIDDLAKATKGFTQKEDEKTTFTTTTSNIDKTKINSLFDSASVTSLQSEIAQLKLDTTAFINTAKTEASALMNVTVPNSTGYEARNLNLTHGTFDMSLNRFSYFFQLLAGPVMLLCSVFAGFILLGGKD